LRQDQCHIVIGSQQGGERSAGKFRGAGEHKAHESALEFALGFEQFAFDAHAFEHGQVFDEHLAHQVVHFVLYANGQQPIGFNHDGLTVLVECLNLDP
jgi:hypothetical protein